MNQQIQRQDDRPRRPRPETRDNRDLENQEITEVMIVDQEDNQRPDNRTDNRTSAPRRTENKPFVRDVTKLKQQTSCYTCKSSNSC